MPLNQTELRALIRYCWRRKLSTRDAAKEICEAEGEGTVGHVTVSRWFKRFDAGDLSLEDKSRSGRPLEVDNGELVRALEDEPHASSREMAKSSRQRRSLFRIVL